jgi:murein L,D-transpeptidase YafK
MSQLWAIQPIARLYQTQGIDAVERALEDRLQEQSYWDEIVGQTDVTLGYYETFPLIVAVDKGGKNLKLYDTQTKELTSLLTHEVITGLAGDKIKEGDLKTPIGVYDLLKRFVPSDTFYGQIAYALSYPNIFDKQQGKTGYGIWIRGHPLDKTPRRYTENTEGCVVMTNDLLEIFDAKVKERKSIAIISENGMPQVDKETMSALLAQIFQWRNSWKYSNIEKYLSFYHEDFKRFDGSGIKSFSQMKRRIFSKDEDKKILFKDLMVVPYPDEKYEPMFRLSYYQVYETKNHQFKGNKEIYLTFKDKKMKILVEQ